ncbi:MULTISPECIES: hypothetical protein [unclassified Chelatococcus]|uniref:hypothetical protein n=1 Tax=unclassified Chelatococcus TaxID=2638111 RepID=UPI001BCE4D34|nr:MULTISPECIES: hypothetical protein [unclassified Chelatococcus]MBS7699541.1 hypothetical protein [Chelatococcus sp. YT9]MBX3560061.1 hypothetical protein [Chelatococcus sp.]
MLTLSAMARPALSADPFAAPVKDCRPCRFSPGSGHPEFALTFVFTGSGQQRQLTALEIARADGGQPQRLRIDKRDAGEFPIATADFPDGFTLDTTDMNFDKLGDLSITTQIAANNTNALYWIYQPDTQSFAPLERLNDDGIETTLMAGSDNRLVAHVLGSAVEYTNYDYEVTGRRAVAVRSESREIDGDLIVEVASDLTSKPSRIISRTVVGFNGGSRDRQNFVRQLDAAATQAQALYKGGDPAGAAAAMKAAIQDIQLGLVVTSYPITNDPGDLKLARQFNDFGFYLAQSNQPKPAIAVLKDITDAAPDRTIAYLNLADAQYAARETADARASYAEFRKRMTAAGKSAEIPPRVGERLR